MEHNLIAVTGKDAEQVAQILLEAGIDNVVVMPPKTFDPVKHLNEDFLREGLRHYANDMETEDLNVETWDQLVEDVRLYLWTGMCSAIEAAERAAGWDPNP